MADEVPAMWAKAKQREWHLGHFHSKKETRFVATDPQGSMVVRILPSLSGQDAWHKSKGFRAPRACEGYLWSQENGLSATFTATPKE